MNIKEILIYYLNILEQKKRGPKPSLNFSFDFRNENVP